MLVSMVASLFILTQILIFKKYLALSLIHESLGIEIWRKNSKFKIKFTIFSVYRVPTGLTEDLITFINKFTELLEQVQNKKAYICCDTNIDLLQISNKPHFNTFYENITQIGFLPKITLPTRLGVIL